MRLLNYNDYILSKINRITEKSKQAIRELIGNYKAEQLIQNIERSIDIRRLEAIMNDYSNNPIKLIRLFSAEANRNRSLSLFKHLKASHFSQNSSGTPIEMSDADLYILLENIAAVENVEFKLNENKYKDALDAAVSYIEKAVKRGLNNGIVNEDALSNNPRIKQYLDISGYPDIESLLPRLKLLQNKFSVMRNNFYGEYGAATLVFDFIKKIPFQKHNC